MFELICNWKKRADEKKASVVVNGIFCVSFCDGLLRVAHCETNCRFFCIDCNWPWEAHRRKLRNTLFHKLSLNGFSLKYRRISFCQFCSFLTSLSLAHAHLQKRFSFSNDKVCFCCVLYDENYNYIQNGLIWNYYLSYKKINELSPWKKQMRKSIKNIQLVDQLFYSTIYFPKCIFLR